MLRRAHKVQEDGWNPTPNTLRSAGIPLPKDNFLSDWINYEYVSVFLLLIINMTLCSLYDAVDVSEFQVVLTMYLFHHFRRFDDVVLCNLTKWTRFAIDCGCILFYGLIACPSPSIGFLWAILLFAMLLTVFLHDPQSNERENFRNRTSRNLFDRVQKCVCWMPLAAMNAFYTLSLCGYSRDSYFRMRWFVGFIALYFWTDEFRKVVGDFAYIIRYMYAVLLLSLTMVTLLVEGTASSFEMTFSIAILVSIACGWVLSVVCLFMLNLFPHEIYAHFTS